MEKSPKENLFSTALYLGIFTIIYNLLEGTISVFFGFEDESLALFGFGIDSYIEMISGIGITHMIYRIKKNNEVEQDKFEITALKITGYSFYFFTFGIVSTGIINLIEQNVPISSFWGVVISIISILVMVLLFNKKLKVGKELLSEPIIADANCTKICIYMSIILLASSGIYELTHFKYVDSIGAFGLAYFSLKEGKECFEKAKGKIIFKC
ncbi:MAG: cation transporter [Bacteroidetes bacterium]|nr:cation transporter [Bacteroidota bacterium]